MKIIYINGRFLTQNITGVQRYAIEIVKTLDVFLSNDALKNKYKFEIIAPRNIRQKVKFNNINIREVGFLKGHLWEQIELPLYTKGKFLFNFCNCAPLIKTYQTVVIHDVAICTMIESYSFIFRLWYKIMFYILGKRLKYIFTVSNFSRQEISKYFNVNLKKIIINYSAANHVLKINPDESIFNKIAVKKGKYILAVSSMNPSKNFKLILKVAKIMPNYKFIIVGSNNKVFKQQGFEINENVKFIGYISDRELVALYKNAYCFVYPSFYEGFGLPPLEAMNYKCISIVSDKASLPEIYMDSALYCNPYDEFDLKEKIILLSKEPIKKKLYEKMKKTLLKYTWEKSTNKFINFLDMINERYI